MSTSRIEHEPAPSHRQGGGAHRAVNRWLSTIALIMSIILMGALIFTGIRLVTLADEIGDNLRGVGDVDSGGGEDGFDLPAPAPEDDAFAPPEDPSMDFGTGLNEDGTPYEPPPGSAPGEYIGPLYPDGSPCIGYGCTPEQDAEISQGEADAND